jgi:hypothetical protein
MGEHEFPLYVNPVEHFSYSRESRWWGRCCVSFAASVDWCMPSRHSISALSQLTQFCQQATHDACIQVSSKTRIQCTCVHGGDLQQVISNSGGGAAEAVTQTLKQAVQ